MWAPIVYFSYGLIGGLLRELAHRNFDTEIFKPEFRVYLIRQLCLSGLIGYVSSLLGFTEPLQLVAAGYAGISFLTHVFDSTGDQHG